MPRRYAVTYEYSEIVRGELREFVHETIIEAADEQAAHARALAYFQELQIQSSIGWARTLRSCAVAPVPKGAVAAGGRRVPRDREIEG